MSGVSEKWRNLSPQMPHPFSRPSNSLDLSEFNQICVFLSEIGGFLCKRDSPNGNWEEKGTSLERESGKR